MTKEEAFIIFKSWQEYIEIADKFTILMLPIPESFLPYPAKTLEEALLIIAKHYLDSGNQERSEKIKELMSFHLAPYYMDGGMTDEQAITNMKKVLDLIEQSPKLKTELLRKLKANQDDWIKSRSKTNGITDK